MMTHKEIVELGQKFIDMLLDTRAHVEKCNSHHSTNEQKSETARRNVSNLQVQSKLHKIRIKELEDRINELEDTRVFETVEPRKI